MPHDRFFPNEYYTEDKNERQSYDLVLPENASGDLGLVLCIHGGGWVEGKKDTYTDHLFEVSKRKGVAAACVNYRYLSDKVCFDGQLDDIAAALSAIRDKGKRYGVNINKVLLTGISAGGHLSLLYAYRRKGSSPVPPVCAVVLCAPTDLENPFFCSAENRVGAAVGTEYFRKILSNGIGFDIDPQNFDAARDAMRKYSPLTYVTKETVPTVFGHGEKDDIVPYRNALDLRDRLTEKKVPHSFVSFPDSNHECENKSSSAAVMKLFFEYIDAYLDPKYPG